MPPAIRTMGTLGSGATTKRPAGAFALMTSPIWSRS